VIALLSFCRLHNTIKLYLRNAKNTTRYATNLSAEPTQLHSSNTNWTSNRIELHSRSAKTMSYDRHDRFEFLRVESNLDGDLIVVSVLQRHVDLEKEYDSVMIKITEAEENRKVV